MTLVVERITRELGLMPKNCVMVLETDPKHYNFVLHAAIGFLTKDKKSNVLYVSWNKPVRVLLRYFDEQKIDYSKVFFVDCVSNTSGSTRSGENFLEVSTPNILTELGLQLLDLLEAKKFDVVFFDAMSTCLIYNSVNECMQFSYYFVQLLRQQELSGILVLIKSEFEQQIVDYILPLADKSVKL